MKNPADGMDKVSMNWATGISSWVCWAWWRAARLLQPTIMDPVVDKNHTGLSPHGISVIDVFVFMSDQDCSQGYLVTGSIIGTYFSHGFGLYSCIFGVFPSVQWFPKLSQALLHDCAMICYVPIVANIAPCMRPLQDQSSECSKYRMS